jgi:beta-glucosidase
MQFAWAKANPEFTPEEAKQIKNADAVIASVGFCPSLESEGFDRSYDLPTEQVDLLQRVSRLNPHTIAVLNAGGNVAMDSWIDGVAGVLHAWYPGQNGNTAVAEAIFGDLNPSGRLADTFERKWPDSPAYGNYPGNSANGGTVKYAEGVYVGYRWYDKKNIAPRFPFGYGLSYTTFAIHDMKVAKQSNEVQVSADVTNTGKRAGTEVVQLYVRPLNSKIDRPIQELKSFARVELQPNETKSVAFNLNPDSFATFDPKKHIWTSPEGQYELAAGSSSRNIDCSQSISWGSVEKAANAK